VVDTSIHFTPDTRLTSEGSSRYPWPINDDGLFFSAELGAQIILDAALLDSKQIKVGEMAYPYFYGWSETWIMTQSYSDVPKLILNAVIELMQKLTYLPGTIWVCPTSVASRNETYQQNLKEAFF